MVEKSSLAPAKISEPGLCSNLGATLVSGGKIIPDQALVLRRKGGRDLGKIVLELAGPFATRREYFEATQQRVSSALKRPRWAQGPR